MLVAIYPSAEVLRIMPKTFKEKVRSIWKGDILWDCPMAKYSTLRVGGSAKGIALPRNRDELSLLVTGLHSYGIKWQVIGRGSNILMPDEGFPGLVIILGPAFSSIKIIKETEHYAAVTVEAGCSLPHLVSWCTQEGLTGLEFGAGIPGGVGGALIMNAGAWGHEIAEVVLSVSFMDNKGRLSVFEKNSLQFGYRKMDKPADAIVVSATFTLQKGDKEKIAAQCMHYHKLRKEKQPQGVASAGSFFKNPENQPAGKLIDEAGLKGLRIGGAMVSEKHANFIVNTGTATAKDIMELARYVQEKVYEHSGVRLEPEVHIFNND